MTAIVIPACDIKDNNRQDLDELLNSIENGDYFPCFSGPSRGEAVDGVSSVVVCFDGCKEEFVDYFTFKYKWIHSIWNQGNRLGFTNNSNQGLKYAHQKLNDSVFLVNQDCVLPSWKYLKLVEGKGLATPSSREVETYLELDNQPRNPKRIPTQRFAFYCTFIAKEVMTKIGYLEPLMKTIFSDDDYCLRALLAGFPVEIVDIAIFHKGTHHDTTKEGSSRSGAYEIDDLGIGLLQYKTKWSVPNHVDHDSIISWVMENFEWNSELIR